MTFVIHSERTNGVKKMIQLKACPRCLGDLMRDSWGSEDEVVCIQCGYRTAVVPAMEYVARKTLAFQSAGLVASGSPLKAA